MSYCNLDEAYNTPFNDQINRYKRQVNYDIPDMYSTQGEYGGSSFLERGFDENSIDCNSSLHIGTKINDLMEEPFETQSNESIPIAKKIEPKEKTITNKNKNEKNDTNEEDDNEDNEEENDKEEESDAKELKKIKEVKADKKEIKGRKVKEEDKKKKEFQLKTALGKAEEKTMTIPLLQSINYTDIKELTFVIVVGIVILFLLDLIVKISKKI